MKFNIHFGQMRPDPYKSGQMRYLKKTPKGKLIMAGLKDGSHKEYVADKLGNVEVVAKKHIEAMVGLGYPIYDGDGRQSPVPMDDLLFPNLNMNSEYWSRINQALSIQRED